MHILFLYIGIIILFKNNDCQNNTNNWYNNTVDNIFIIIHGTFAYSFSSIFFDSSEKELISQRWNKTKNKSAEQKGLIDISDKNNPEEYLKREVVIIDYKKKNNSIYRNTRYYKYNWDGFLSEKNRNKAAKILAEELLLLKKQFPDAKIHIIGYSHGGNVAVNIVKYLPPNSPLIINQLILLATPIGSITERLANKKNKSNQYYFKEIICFYSQGDLTQIKDFLFNFPLCSRFLKKRKKNVTIIECYYQYEDSQSNRIINYLPNHKDFWLPYDHKLISKTSYTFLPVILHLPEIIGSRNLYNTKAKKKLVYPITKIKSLPLKQTTAKKI